MAKRSTVEKEEEERLIPHPRERDELLGHGEAEQHVLALFNAKKLPHAWLISGEKGIGKATFAYRVARFLLTPQDTAGGLFGDALPPESLRVGPEKETFKRIAAGSHSDLLVLEGEDIKVDETRKVGSFLSMTPAESDWRVVIIDSADAMNRNAANALLKVLEEPPARAILLLVSHNPGSLLPTIRSRCRVLGLKPLSEKHFSEVFSVLLPEIGTDEKHALSILAGGSVGVALEMHEQQALPLYQDILNLLQQKDTQAQHSFAEQFSRKDSESAFAGFTRIYPWLLACLATRGLRSQAEIFAGEGQALDAIGARKTSQGWIEAWEKAEALLRDADRLYLDKKQVILTLIRD